MRVRPASRPNGRSTGVMGASTRALRASTAMWTVIAFRGPIHTDGLPPGATAQCSDGTYLVQSASSGYVLAPRRRGRLVLGKRGKLAARNRSIDSSTVSGNPSTAPSATTTDRRPGLGRGWSRDGSFAGRPVTATRPVEGNRRRLARNSLGSYEADGSCLCGDRFASGRPAGVVSSPPAGRFAPLGPARPLTHHQHRPLRHRRAAQVGTDED
jgi:hypothetical protein